MRTPPTPTPLQERAHGVLERALSDPHAASLHVVRVEHFGVPFGADEFYVGVLQGTRLLAEWRYTLEPVTREKAGLLAQSAEARALVLAHAGPLPPMPVACWNGRRAGITTLVARFCAFCASQRAAVLVLVAGERQRRHVAQLLGDARAERVTVANIDAPVHCGERVDLVLVDGAACDNQDAILALLPLVAVGTRFVMLPSAPTPWLDAARASGVAHHLLRADD